MKTRKLKYYLSVRRWLPGASHSGFNLPGQWSDRYIHKFSGHISRAAYLAEHKPDWDNAKATDGHALFLVELIQS